VVAKDLEELEVERRRLYEDLSQIGDFRRGTIAQNYRRCGKSNCCCGEADHPGHGPQYLLMTKVEGRSRAQNLRAGAELDKTRREVENQRRFRDLVQQIVAVNERICAGRPIEYSAAEIDRARLKKKLLRSSRRKRRGKSSA
jgi:hypothetical protein